MTRKPNIVLFVPDSYRGDVLGHQENPGAVTPNLDRFVEEGAVSYRNAFAQNPVCTPSRCSFMTGLYPHVHGHRSMRNMLKEQEPNLLTVLKREGYRILWSGKNDLVRVRTKDDYARYCEEKIDPTGQHLEEMHFARPPALKEDDPRHGVYYKGVRPRCASGEEPRWDRDTAWVCSAIDRIDGHTGDDPLCCYIPLTGPHPAYEVNADAYDAIDPKLLPPSIGEDGTGNPEVLEALRKAYGSEAITEETWREIKRIYYGMCTTIDGLFGRVVEALKDRGLYDDTWILFFSDHGDFAGDYGLPEKTHSTLQDSLLHVPLIVKPPVDVPTAGGSREALTELIDITATLYDCLDVDPGYAHQGHSLRESLAGDDEEIREAVFATVGAREGEQAFINRQVELMPPGSFYVRQSGATNSHHAAGSHAVTCRTHRHKYVHRAYTGHHELYDLEKDPGELINLSGSTSMAEVQRALRDRLLDHLIRTSDTLPYEADSRSI
ncbi:MAG: arylsulfatase [Gemmatimonadetes bacterium]|nr:arylsulfatase [Gemmatimonadota bacterium]|tara:strand:- start:3 stop:1481 length:1479 start_codon:yes stop_codon:yes gene_type:complete